MPLWKALVRVLLPLFLCLPSEVLASDTLGCNAPNQPKGINTPKPGRRNARLDMWRALCSRRVQRLKRKLPVGQQSKVFDHLVFTVSQDGRIQTVRPVNSTSSQSTALAQDLLMRSAPFPMRSKDANEIQESSWHIEFRGKGFPSIYAEEEPTKLIIPLDP